MYFRETSAACLVFCAQFNGFVTVTVRILVHTAFVAAWRRNILIRHFLRGCIYAIQNLEMIFFDDKKKLFLEMENFVFDF